MPDQDKRPTYEERIAACPIHQWGDVGGYLVCARVPGHPHRAFHELILVRGEYPRNMSATQGREFGRRAVEITHEYQLRAEEAQPLRVMFSALVEQWLVAGAKNN